MNLRANIATETAHAIAWALQHIAHRPGANMPGKVALAIDPQIIADVRGQLLQGSIAVLGTNGKTTVTALIAQALREDGCCVVTNATGANLDSGIASALLAADVACGKNDWGVFECDELWCTKVFPQLQPRFVVLLNLFRDQLDRMGEIDTVQDTIVSALGDVRGVTLIYNADDPFCEGVARRAEAQGQCITVGFGVGVALEGSHDSVVDSGVCQDCGAMLTYRVRQYSQLGQFACPTCGFARRQPTYELRGYARDSEGMRLDIARVDGPEQHYFAPVMGNYMAYNLLGAVALLGECGIAQAAQQQAFSGFAVEGRQQRLVIEGRSIFVNLAKNPVGMNQGLGLVCPGDSVLVVINDKEADGHDVSWLWDVDFEQLVGRARAVFASGLRKEDLQVCLKYAGVDATLVESVQEAFVASTETLVVLANYTALPRVLVEVQRMLS